MSEAIKTIISAWSVAAIVLWFVWASVFQGTTPESKVLYAAIWIFLFLCAATGAGWLIYRSNEEDTEKNHE